MPRSENRARWAATQTIKTVSEAEIATERIASLAGCLEGSTEEIELIGLIFALEVWETQGYWRGTGTGRDR